MIPLTRKQEAALWREIGRGFEKYHETGVYSWCTSKSSCWTLCGLCLAWQSLTGSAQLFNRSRVLFDSVLPDWGSGGGFKYTRKDAGVRALFAYLMAEVCPFTSGIL